MERNGNKLSAHVGKIDLEWEVVMRFTYVKTKHTYRNFSDNKCDV